MNAKYAPLLETALVQAFNMDDDDAQATAAVILEAFGGSEEIADDDLPADLRSIFYTLEGKRLMSFRREDRVNEEGAKRRAFYWRVREEELSRTAAESEPALDADLYDSIPMEAWSRNVRAS